MRIALLERGAGFEEFSESPPSLSALSNAAKGARTVETDSVEFFGESEVLLPILRKSAGKAVFSGCEVVRDGVRAYELSEEGVLARGLILGKLDGFTLPVRAGGAVVTVVVDRVKKPQDGELEIAGRITESVGDFQLSAIETALAEKLSGITGMRISCYLKEQKKF